MPPIIKIILFWLLSGYIAYLLNQNTPKLQGEEPLNFWRCMLFGPGLLLALLSEIFGQTNYKE